MSVCPSVPGGPAGFSVNFPYDISTTNNPKSLFNGPNPLLTTLKGGRPSGSTFVYLSDASQAAKAAMEAEHLMMQRQVDDLRASYHAGQ